MSIDNFVVGNFYKREDIRKKLQLGQMGGIRVGTKQNIITLFWNSEEEKTESRKLDKFGRMNIYHDYYDQRTGLFNYTGARKTR